MVFGEAVGAAAGAAAVVHAEGQLEGTWTYFLMIRGACCNLLRGTLRVARPVLTLVGPEKAGFRPSHIYCNGQVQSCNGEMHTSNRKLYAGREKSG